MSGKSIEVINTDAEGRLILALTAFPMPSSSASRISWMRPR